MIGWGVKVLAGLWAASASAVGKQIRVPFPTYTYTYTLLSTLGLSGRISDRVG
jgi:hypothetical protein